jgi:hypothetical protein
LITHDLASLGNQILAMECPWGVPTFPKVLCKSVERIGRSRFGFGGVDSQVAVHLELPRPTSLTGAGDRCDRCWPFVGFASGELPSLCGFGSWCYWSVLGWFCGVFLGFV